NASRIIYPTSENGDGTQVNAAGAFIAKYAPNPEGANKLIAFLLSDEAQQIYADQNYEYPVVPSVKPAELTLSWGTLTPSVVSFNDIAAYRDEAAAMVDELQFNAGPQNYSGAHRPGAEGNGEVSDRQQHRSAGLGISARPADGPPHPVPACR